MAWMRLEFDSRQVHFFRNTFKERFANYVMKKITGIDWVLTIGSVLFVAFSVLIILGYNVISYFSKTDFLFLSVLWLLLVNYYYLLKSNQLVK